MCGGPRYRQAAGKLQCTACRRQVQRRYRERRREQKAGVTPERHPCAKGCGRLTAKTLDTCLKCNRQGRVDGYDPPPAEIEAACAAILARLSPDELAQRANRPGVTIPSYSRHQLIANSHIKTPIGDEYGAHEDMT